MKNEPLKRYLAINYRKLAHQKETEEKKNESLKRGAV